MRDPDDDLALLDVLAFHRNTLRTIQARLDSLQASLDRPPARVSFSGIIARRARPCAVDQLAPVVDAPEQLAPAVDDQEQPADQGARRPARARRPKRPPTRSGPSTRAPVVDVEQLAPVVDVEHLVNVDAEQLAPVVDAEHLVNVDAEQLAPVVDAEQLAAVVGVKRCAPANDQGARRPARARRPGRTSTDLNPSDQDPQGKLFK